MVGGLADTTDGIGDVFPFNRGARFSLTRPFSRTFHPTKGFWLNPIRWRLDTEELNSSAPRAELPNSNAARTRAGERAKKWPP